MSTAPRITVAICTRNRARLLDNTFDSLTRLELPASLAWELLVVDNGSTDDTPSVCASYAGQLPLRLVRERQPGLSHARNRVLQESRGDYIVFTDDDVLVEPHWLAAFVDATNRWPDAATFGGPIKPHFAVPPDHDLLAAFPALGWGFCGLDHKCAAGPLADNLYVIGANMAFRRSAVDGLRFDPTLGRTPTSQIGGEEDVFQKALRARGGYTVWCPEMRLEHYVDPSRMTRKYLTTYYVGQGEQYIRLYAGPIPLKPSLFGAPRWIVRKTIEAFLAYLMATVTKPRAEALRRLRSFCEYRGMVRGCRLQARQAASRPHAPGTASPTVTVSR